MGGCRERRCSSSQGTCEGSFVSFKGKHEVIGGHLGRTQEN